MPPFLRWSIFIVIVGLVTFWVLTRPDALSAEAIEGRTGDPKAGAMAFAAAGCASCHVAPESETGEGGPVLSGGQAFATAFGTFHAPNITPDPEAGVGRWSDLELVNAIQRGVSPDGGHYYPAFPYDNYIRADTGDVLDLIAYLRTLPEDATPSRPHEIGFPFNIRRTLGLWKLLFVSDDWVVDAPLDETQTRGRYLVESLGHCGACHTPRNLLGGSQTARWLGGAPNPSGKGRIPGIDPAHLEWSGAEIVEYLTSGFTPDYDSVGGEMVAVVDKISTLPEADREAIAAYLRAVPRVE